MSGFFKISWEIKFLKCNFDINGSNANKLYYGCKLVEDRNSMKLYLSFSIIFIFLEREREREIQDNIKMKSHDA